MCLQWREALLSRLAVWAAGASVQSLQSWIHLPRRTRAQTLGPGSLLLCVLWVPACCGSLGAEPRALGERWRPGTDWSRGHRCSVCQGAPQSAASHCGWQNKTWRSAWKQEEINQQFWEGQIWDKKIDLNSWSRYPKTPIFSHVTPVLILMAYYDLVTNNTLFSFSFSLVLLI